MLCLLAGRHRGAAGPGATLTHMTQVQAAEFLTFLSSGLIFLISASDRGHLPIGISGKEKGVFYLQRGLSSLSLDAQSPF